MRFITLVITLVATSTFVAAQNNNNSRFRNGQFRNRQNGFRNRQGQGQNGQKGQNGQNGNNSQVSKSISATAATSASAVASPINANNGQAGKGNNTGNNGNQDNNGNNGGVKSSSTSTSAAAAATAAVAATGQSQGNIKNAQALQSSLQLDSSQIMKADSNVALDASNPLLAASSTSTNNYINNCALFPQLPLTNGQQVLGGSCNPTPMGVLPSVDKQPAVKITFPQNMGNVAANTDFTITIATKNIAVTTFNNPTVRYFSEPQTLDSSGSIIGHVHVSCQQMQSLTSNEILDPKTFAFFNGIDDQPSGGLLSVTVPGGLAAGSYRCGTITSSASHTPAVGPVAKHGVFEDIVYFTVGGTGGQAAQNANTQNGSQGDNPMNSNGKMGKGRNGGRGGKRGKPKREVSDEDADEEDY